MSNSSLAKYSKISPNRTSPRDHAIDTITIHCYVGQVSVQDMGAWFAKSEAQSSANYGIGVDGTVGMFVEEKDRSWCSSNRTNDMRAITIECASDKTSPYAINDKVYASLIKLCADICKRNGIKKLVWSTDKNQRVNHLNGCNLTVHRDYAAKACPGDYIYNRLGQIANEVNALIGATDVLYRVRKSWVDEKSQIFAGTLDGAKRIAEQNPGYYVYDEAGKLIYGVADAVSAPAPTTEAKGIPASKEDYIEKVGRIAVELYPITKILPSVITSQAFLENGGGVAADAIELTKRNNLFGLKSSLLNSSWKAYTKWDGTSFSKVTPEYYGGKLTYITDSFRVYPDYKTCILDYEMFLTHVQNANGYKYRAVVGKTDPAEVITIISKGGYATDPAYINKVLNIIYQYDLTKYDREAGVTESNVLNHDRYLVVKGYKNGKAIDQLGAFSVLDNAKAMVATHPGYYVYDTEAGKSVFPKAIIRPREVQYYRVATDFKSGKYVGQLGAYTSKDNAIDAAKKSGVKYKVYSPDGQIIYSAPVKTESKKTTTVKAKDIYAVRRALNKKDSQIGLFSDIDKARKLADERWGFNVYNIETNKPVYKPVLMNWQKVCASAIELGEEVLKDIAAGHAWEYAGSGERTFAKAREKGNYKANCSGGVYWILRNAGVIPSSYSCNWYGTIGGFKWLTPTAEAEARKYFDIIDIHNKTVNQCIKDGTLHPGDIICYETFSHTNMYLGNNTSFDSGHNNCHGSGNGAKFYRWVSPLTCGGYKIAQIMRIKENNVTAQQTSAQYRVQAGEYMLKDNANNMLTKVKKAGFDAKIVTVNGMYIVQLGVFSVKSNADALVTKAAKAGIVCIANKI